MLSVVRRVLVRSVRLARLMENMIEVIRAESTNYGGLIELSSRKTSIIIEGDLEVLPAIM